MAIYNATNPVTIGASTRKEHMDRVFDNTVAVREGERSVANQVANDILVALDANNLTRGVGLTFDGAVLTAPTVRVDDAAPATAPATLDRIYSDLQIRAWAIVRYSGGTPSIIKGVNVENITGSTTGRWSIDFVTDMPSIDFLVIIDPNDADPRSDLASLETKAVGSIEVQTDTSNLGNEVDADVDFVVIGG